jgi:hypothetical protein
VGSFENRRGVSGVEPEKLFAYLCRMPDRSRKRPADRNQLAKSIVDLATGESPPSTTPDDGKDPAAVSLGRRGGLKGGKARAASLTPKQRSEIAKKAAAKRWAKKKR